MISTRSNRTLEQWTEEFVRRLQKQTQADRAENIPAYNRLHKKIVEALTAIENAGSPGREVLEELMEHEMPQVRLWAAGRVIQWNPDRAIPVLGRLLIEKLPEESAPVERMSIRGTASSHLEKFFGITNFDRNELIEPLKAYGIDVPRQTERPWF
ncbi:hypothetical protein ATN84_00060 [Paramesorhizobium deserti]|uniref:DUF2019 domain-containing protein n=1 Tax=Paramesorhizobium deserti TaxID=1494590 RepID=A0A135HYJ7_9HYPH|nr:DUF2019 domain-containing protein [Paramesorhizobium deserti]KXF78243.1 hypothetical protein ATN84_00060 [Paramesorhizobium deserti]